ncbi:MAG: hypothetical protein FJY85_07785, partial [Deltaproteobacteria bacterium]|nr:hypothetical protein [Deltaproteobacteria bacterium]
MRKIFSRLRLGGSLRNKLVIYFILIAAIPLVVSGGIGYYTITTESERWAEREMRAIADSAAQTANEFMNGRCTDVLVWSDLRLIKEAIEVAEVREDASETLREMVKLYGAYQAVALMDRNGNCVASSWPALVGTDFSKDRVFAGAKEGKLVLSDVHKQPLVEKIEPASKGWTLAVAAPVKVAGNVMGVLMAYLNWKPIQSLMSEIKLGETGYVYI